MYENSVFLFLDRSIGVESTAVSTLHRSIEKKNTPKNFNLSIFQHHRSILALFLIISFPDEYDVFLRTFFGMRPSKNTEKSDIKF